VVSRDLSTAGLISPVVTRFVPHYASTLHSLQLIKDPFEYCHTDSDRWLEKLSRAAVGELAFCENIKFLEISGFIYIPEDGARVFAKGHTELEAVMLTYPAFGDYKKRELKV
jgi:hypothetical protein